MMEVQYEIRAGKTAPCELWSVVQNPGLGSRAENYVCQGTYTYCARIKAELGCKA